MRPAGQDAWSDESDNEAIRAVPNDLEALRGFVPTFYDVVPHEAAPYVTGVEETNEQLPVVPLEAPTQDAVADANDGADDLIAVSDGESSPAETGPTGPVTVRRYILTIDTAAFAAAEPFAYTEWLEVGVGQTGTLDVWVDDVGVVRRFIVEDGQGGSITFTFNDVADRFADFQNTEIVASPDLPEVDQ